MQKQQCPCCGYYSLHSRGEFETCEICCWVDGDAAEEYGELVETSPIGELRARGASLFRAPTLFFLLIAGFVSGGTVSTILARRTAIRAIDALHLRPDAPLPEGVSSLPVPVSGWDTAHLIIVTALALLLGFLITLAIRRRRAWGVVACILTLVVLTALWFDAYAVSNIFGIAGCNGCNWLWGEAERDINVAGWLYVATGMLCCTAIARLRATANAYPSP